jgi:hypothetical protein
MPGPNGQECGVSEIKPYFMVRGKYPRCSGSSGCKSFRGCKSGWPNATCEPWYAQKIKELQQALTSGELDELERIYFDE